MTKRRLTTAIAMGSLAPIGIALLQAAPQVTQGPRDSAPTFEIVSIRENRSVGGGQGMRLQPGGQLVMTNQSLRPLVVFAYGLLPQQVVGGPAWLDSTRFDIVAKAAASIPPSPPGGPPGPAQLMLQRLLADRFKLVVRTEMREMPIYALILARSDQQLGPRMRRSQTDCAEAMAAYARGEGPIPPREQCGLSGGAGRITAAGTSIPMLAKLILSAPAGRIVEDRTGLTGTFDFQLEFTPELSADQRGPNTASPADQPPLFTALEEQLGLKLQPRREPVSVLVVERAEPPTEN
jgi:uncharacterized protein (TIGR03435 family)